MRSESDRAKGLRLESMRHEDGMHEAAPSSHREDHPSPRHCENHRLRDADGAGPRWAEPELTPTFSQRSRHRVITTQGQRRTQHARGGTDWQ
jgi:hypothetical protein